MKRTLLTIALAIAVCLNAEAQEGAKDPQILQDLRENIFRTGVNLNPYEYLPTAETPVPKGFKPFYISHYGRHGARTGSAGKLYPGMLETLSRAGEAGILTPDGEKSLECVREINRLHDGMDGRLTRLGTLEHRQIAGRMYDKYGKTVFSDKKRPRVRALSSMTRRCIISMTAFTGELIARNPGLDFWWDTGETLQPIVSTGDSKEIKKEAYKILHDYNDRHIPDTAALYARLFTDPAAARAITGDALLFTRSFLSMACYCAPWELGDAMLRCLTEDDLYHHTVRHSISLYLRQCNSIEFGDERMKPVELLVDDIIKKADEVINGSDVAADLRFGHDYQLLAIESRLGLSGVAERRNKETCLTWRGYLYSPFAGNMQMVFYRNRKGEVLVKFFMNEREATCILLEGGPYYRWEDFKRAVKYRPVMGEVEEVVQSSCPEISGLYPAPGGGWFAASDENGVWHISASGETKPVWITSDDWTDCEGVTVDPATKDIYYVVEGKQALCRLRAPGYKDPETLLILSDIAFDSNHGLEGVTWYKDGTILLGNQYQPVQLIKYSVKDGVILSRKDLQNTSEIGDMFYDAQTGFLWIIDSFKFNIHLCNSAGEVLLSYPIPFIANGEGLCVDHENSCIWIGDDETSKLYKIHFDNL